MNGTKMDQDGPLQFVAAQKPAETTAAIPQGGGEISTGTSAPAAKTLATDVTGTWKAEFNTQIGTQKYTFILKQDGTTLTGKANADINGEKRETELKEGKIKP